MKGRNDLLELLKELDISYKSYSHSPIRNVEDAKIYAKDIGGAHCKNLFIKDTDRNLYLVITLDRKRINLKKLARQVGSKRLSFVSPELMDKFLGIEPGCVTPFALINDKDSDVMVIFDKDILKDGEMSFHPLVNTETITICQEDLFKFLDYYGQKRIMIENCNKD